MDSTWNGTLIGAAIAPALVYGIWRWEDNTSPDSNSLKGVMTVGFGTLSSMTSILIAQAIDLSINESIYERPSQASRVTVTPLIGRYQKGLAVRVGF